MEFLSGGILGSVFGGIFRLIPELIKFFDRKDERSHELKMFQQQTDLEKVKGTFKVEEKYVDYSVSEMNAISKAFEEQSNIASKSYKWVASVSALVRPVITYVLFGLYVCFKVTSIIYAINSGANWYDIMIKSWTVDDFAMLNMILTFWFVGRAIEKYQK